jgi:hypothetical protein
MNVSELEKKGFTILQVDKNVLNNLKKDILKSIKKKLNLPLPLQKKSLDNQYQQLSSKINNIDQKIFLKNFGDVSMRYCSFNTGKVINKWISGKLKKNFNFNKYSLPYPMTYQLKDNKKLKKNQYCIYFRCVRSNKKDVGYIHRDIDFWNIEKPIIPNKMKNYQKVYKIWIPIFGCDKSNSLTMLEKSQKFKFKIKYIKKKFLKPSISKKELKKFKTIAPIKNFNNEAILFDYAIAHYAPVNITRNYRVSAEFTVLCK